MEVIVPTCSGYRDTWEPMHRLLDTYWPDCPWPIRVVTDIRPGDAGEDPFAPFPGGIAVGRDRGWTGNLVAALRDRDARSVILLLQDDFFLTARVRTDVLHAAARLVASDPEVGCLRLYPCPGPADGVERGEVLGLPWGEVWPGEAYRISCQAALWRVGYLRRALACGTTAMEFELTGSQRCGAWPERVLGLLRGNPLPWPLEYLCSGITRGRWNPDALRLMEANGIRRTGTRPVDGTGKHLRG